MTIVLTGEEIREMIAKNLERKSLKLSGRQDIQFKYDSESKDFVAYVSDVNINDSPLTR